MKTTLYDKHLSLGAKIVNFSGWMMPLQYKGILQEHQAVRTHVGIFDVSHMGRVNVSGPEAELFLDYLSTNTIAGKKELSAIYTVLCLPSGGSVDDVIIYKIDSQHFFLIVNAGNREKDLAHLNKFAERFDVTIQDLYATDGILAIQGPKALNVAEKIFLEVNTLKPFRFLQTHYEDEEIILSGTGYTGSGGCEIYAPNQTIVKLWDRFLIEGQDCGIQPIGLGARDTLRLEMGYALYGHELTETIAPTESIAEWTVKLEKKDFLGKDALLDLEQNGKKRFEYGITMMERGIAREGYEVFKNEQVIGTITSGTHSPSLGESIAIALVNKRLPENDVIHVKIRGKLVKAKVVTLPFYKVKP